MVAFALIRGTSSRLAELNPQVQEGLQVLEVDTGKFKIGDGQRRWNDLDYYLPELHIKEAIQEALADLDLGSNGGTIPGQTDLSALMVHVNDSLPHPAYDEGPSLLLLYQNAKV